MDIQFYNAKLQHQSTSHIRNKTRRINKIKESIGPMDKATDIPLRD
jgi:hypothetical protein